MLGWSGLLLLSCAEPDEPDAVPPADRPPAAEPPPPTELNCGDGEDDDQDGLIDCEDSDCICIETDCYDGVDDDQDGLIDCEDSDCLSACMESDCADGIDNDQDGLQDCEDSDCFEQCVEVCDDKQDNDQDGQADCDDDECFGIADCGGPYTVQLYHEDLYIFWARDIRTGPQSPHPYPFFAGIRSEFSLTATPMGSWGGRNFSCTGSLYTRVGLDYSDINQAYEIGGAYIGATPMNGSGYMIDFSPQKADNSLDIPSSSCPVTDLPSIRLVFLRRYESIHLYDEDVGLMPQYFAPRPREVMLDNYDGSRYTVRFMEQVQTNRLRTWTGFFD